MSQHPRLLMFSLVCLLALGCGESDETGRVRIAVSDAPFAFEVLDSAIVWIDRVEVHVTGDRSDATGWAVVDENDHRLNLLELTNGITAPLVDAEVPVGTLSQIRLHVREASVTLKDGRTFDLDIPSGEQSGIKIFPDPTIEVVGSLTTELLLDFDVSRSFHPIPASATHSDEIREFFFRPSLRCANLSETGSLSGVVWSNAGSPANLGDDVVLAHATITAVRDGEIVSSTATDSDGHYMLVGLLPDSYSLEASATGFTAATRAARVVVGNDIGGNDFRLSPSDAGRPNVAVTE